MWTEKDQVPEFPDWNLTGNWSRDHKSYIWAKNLYTFALCLETLWKAQFKSSELTDLAEEILK